MLFGHSEMHKAQPSYVCVFTFITLFALQINKKEQTNKQKRKEQQQT